MGDALAQLRRAEWDVAVTARAALDTDASLRTVRNIIKNGLDLMPDESPPPPVAATGGYLHGPGVLLEGPW